MSGKQAVLVVDLEGALVKTNLLHESLWSTLSENIRTAALTLLRIFGGGALLKASLASSVNIDPSGLPYNLAVLDAVRCWRRNGGRTALITNSDRSLAEAIAGHLEIFDEVYVIEAAENRGDCAKSEFLKQHVGADQYDYVGGVPADLPVWKSARRAITVAAPKALRIAVEGVSREVQHLESVGGWPGHLKMCRPLHWLKNVLVFLPAVAAHDLSAETWLAALLAFFAFSLVASGVYILNDLLDLAADRAHPAKRHRALASGTVSLAHGMVMGPALVIAGLLFAPAVGRFEFLGVLVAYFALTMAYSLFLKRKLVIDVCTLAGLYTMRILAGGAATGITLSIWLLSFSVFFFLSLAAVKRQSELVGSVASGRRQISGRAYQVDDLPIISMMAIAAGYVAVLVMALYINSPAVQSLYGRPGALWGACPLLLYWISRMVLIAHRGNVGEDPIVFAVRDRTSLICGFLIIGIVLIGHPSVG
jgi:4-hydroxybenzoate polyprenyltransferase